MMASKKKQETTNNMARISGYQVTVKLFIPAPKTDFKAQSKAASIMAAIMSDGVLTPELVAAAKVIGVEGKFTSMEEPAVVQTEQTETPIGAEPGGETQSDEPPADGPRKAAKSRG